MKLQESGTWVVIIVYVLLVIWRRSVSRSPWFPCLIGRPIKIGAVSRSFRWRRASKWYRQVRTIQGSHPPLSWAQTDQNWASDRPFFEEEHICPKRQLTLKFSNSAGERATWAHLQAHLPYGDSSGSTHQWTLKFNI